MTRRTLVAFALLALAAPALADDLSPPTWRGSPGTTVQHWDFSAGPAGGAPDALPFNNPYGPSSLAPLGAATWLPTAMGRNDVWDLSANGTLDFRVANTGNSANQKELWLQVTFFSVAALPPPSYTVLTVGGTPFTLLGSTVTALPGGWAHELTRWVIPVCPTMERVTISPGQVGAITLIDQVVIDTQCAIPTPGAASVLALGGLVAIRRRRH